MSKYNLVNIRKNSIDEKNSIKNSVGYKKRSDWKSRKLEIDNKNRLTIRYREPFNLLARNHLNGLVPETGLEPAPRN